MKKFEAIEDFWRMTEVKSLLLLSSRLRTILQFEGQKRPEVESFVYSHSSDVQSIVIKLKRFEQKVNFTLKKCLISRKSNILMETTLWSDLKPLPWKISRRNLQIFWWEIYREKHFPLPSVPSSLILYLYNL